MKKIFFCLIIFIATNDLKAENKDGLPPRFIHFFALTDTATYPITTLSGVNWSFYLNQPINTLLLDLDDVFPGYILSTVYANERLRMAARINVYYGNGRGLILSVSHFQFIDPYSQDGTPWDVTLFRKEKISRIELWDNTVCVFDSNP